MLPIGMEGCKELLPSFVIVSDSIIVKVAVLIHVVDVSPASISFSLDITSLLQPYQMFSSGISNLA